MQFPSFDTETDRVPATMDKFRSGEDSIPGF